MSVCVSGLPLQYSVHEIRFWLEMLLIKETHTHANACVNVCPFAGVALAMGKRARTNPAFASGRQLLHTCSGKKLDRLLSMLKDDPSLVDMSRRQRMDADSQLFDHMVHVFDVPLEDGTVFHWETLHILASAEAYPESK